MTNRTGAGRIWLLYPVLLLVVMGAWAISSPAGSSPDEDYHLTSAWCAWGIREGFCGVGQSAGSRVVPQDVGSIACYAFKPNESAKCPDHHGEMVETSRGNFVGYYPDVFYRTMGLLVTGSIEWSVLAMRFLNIAIYALGVSALLALSRPGHRANVVIGSLVTLVPLGLFTVASVNPSSWAITSATLLWAGGVEFVGSPDPRRKVGLAALTCVALLLAVGSRADAAVAGGLALGLVWFMTAKFNRRTLITGAVVAAVVLAVVAWASTLGSIQQLGYTPPSTPPEPPKGWKLRLEALPGFFLGTFGTRGLGWLDTVMQPYVWGPAAAAYVLALLWGLRRCGWRKALALIVVLGGSAAVVDVIATIRHTMPERALQPRYFLPMLVLAVMISLADGHPDGPAPGANRGKFAVRTYLVVGLAVAVGLVVAQAGALHTNLKRYLTGLDYPGRNLDNNIEWWWTWAPSPMVVLGIGSLAFLGAAGVAAYLARRSPAPIASLIE